ncbi:hypothetical protein PHET_05782 [Paragonimus heterotremus]|uniref:Uncharacterized protein n=1 Tax=Paragonimus heterotremus TaxID=100268 RepID=A0A8J4WHR2_9TREM|nr:hypothetical protein PHET_05782 [Paragonimus heterotremus]
MVDVTTFSRNVLLDRLSYRYMWPDQWERSAHTVQQGLFGRVDAAFTRYIDYPSNVRVCWTYLIFLKMNFMVINLVLSKVPK